MLSSCALFGGFAVAHRFHSAEHESQSVPGSVLLGCIAALARCGLLLQMEYYGLSFVCRLISVCLSVMTVSPAKIAELIKIPFGM